MLRDDKTATLEDLAIFGKMIVHKSQQERLQLLNVIKHFTVPCAGDGPKGKASNWRRCPTRRPRWKPASTRASARCWTSWIWSSRSDESYKKFEPVLKPYVSSKYATSSCRPRRIQVGKVLDAMLNDKADAAKPEALSSSQFWTQKNPKIGELRKKIKDIVDQALYGDPFVVARQFGKGRVLAVMTTAGPEWNDWGHGLAPRFAGRCSRSIR